MNIRCRLGFHKPYIEDKPNTAQFTVAEILADQDRWVDEVLDAIRDADPEAKVVFGGIRRYCGRCGVTLPGDEPRIGDRKHAVFV